MLLFKRFGVACLSLSMLLSVQAGLASSLAFTANGSNITAFEGDLPAKSIGGVLLPKGSVGISGNTITVNAVPEWLFDKHAVLTGTVINPKLTNENNQSTVSGIAYFTKGEWLTNLGRNRADEVVATTGGEAFSGHIGATTATTLDMVLTDGTRKSINFSDVSTITSPRAYTFRIPASSVKIEPSDGSYSAEANDITFSSAMFHSRLAVFSSNKPHVPKSTLPGTEGGVSNKYIATMIATDIIIGTIAPAIAIPIVFTRSTLHSRQLLFEAANQAIGQPPRAPQFQSTGLYLFPTR